jgi:hypothetical protein
MAVDRGDTALQQQGRNMKNKICAERQNLREGKGEIGDGGGGANRRRKKSKNERIRK